MHAESSLESRQALLNENNYLTEEGADARATLMTKLGIQDKLKLMMLADPDRDVKERAKSALEHIANVAVETAADDDEASQSSEAQTNMYSLMRRILGLHGPNI